MATLRDSKECFGQYPDGDECRNHCELTHECKEEAMQSMRLEIIEGTFEDKKEVTEQWIKDHLADFADRAGYILIPKTPEACPLKIRRIIRQ
jgi:hypothetical protein